MSKKIIKIGGLDIEIIKRSRQKNLYIRVTPPDGNIIISVPARTPGKIIKNFVLRKIPDIIKAQERMRNQFRQSKREYISGESCYYLGVPYMLQVIYHDSKLCKVERVPNKIIMTVPINTSCEKRRNLLTEWYRSELKKILPAIIKRCENKMNLHINDCKIRNMKTRWGSCNITKKSILINLQLVKKPLECLEYVMTHEFIHLIERNHTHKFRSLLDKYYPEWRSAKQILNEMPLDYWEK